MGAKNGHKHYHDTYACKHSRHDSGEGYHVLVSNKHKKNPENNKLMDKFNVKVIQKYKHLPNKRKILKNY